MELITRSLNKQEYNLSFIQENIETIAYSALVFLVPFMIGHPQFLVGTLVNAALILGALNVRNYKLLPIVMLPSIAVLSKGLIFGPFTIFLVYLIPFIWASNFIIVLMFKKFNLDMGFNKWISLGAAALLKAAFLFLAAFIMIKLSVLPALFLTTMGLFQLYTALAGGVLAFAIHAGKKKLIKPA